MLILINDNNIFIDGLVRSEYNYRLILNTLEYILVKEYSLPTIHQKLDDHTQLMHLTPITRAAIHAEINRLLPMLATNANYSNLLYIGILNERIAIANQNIWS